MNFKTQILDLFFCSVNEIKTNKTSNLPSSSVETPSSRNTNILGDNTKPLNDSIQKQYLLQLLPRRIFNQEVVRESFTSVSPSSLPSPVNKTLGREGLITREISRGLQANLQANLEAKKNMAITGKKEHFIPRILLVTYFRSGSSFLGDLLQSTPRTFYSFEPLHFMTSGYRISSERIEEAFLVLNKLFSCSFPELSFYIKWALNADHRFLFKWNNFLWNSCQSHRRLCYNPSFLKAICLKASVHLMKVTRLHMNQVSDFIDRQDHKVLSSTKQISTPHSISEIDARPRTSTKSHEHENLFDNTSVINQVLTTKETNEGIDGETSELLNNHLKVVLLVRDPRGIFSSRKSLYWCKNDSCLDPSVICQEMEQDVIEFDRLHSQEPNRFTLVRYEDLSLNPEKEAVRLFQRLRLPFSPERLGQFLRSHTSLPSSSLSKKRNRDVNPYSTQRDSRSTALEWMNKLTKEEVSSVQKSCSGVMLKLGYKLLPSNWTPGDLDYFGQPEGQKQFREKRQHYFKRRGTRKINPRLVIQDLPDSRRSFPMNDR